MNNLSDSIKWLALQNAINLNDDDIKELTSWLLNDKNYQKLNDELIRRMKIMEGR